MGPCLVVTMLAIHNVAGLGAPTPVASLDAKQQEIVDFAVVQLQGGEHGPCRRKPRMEKFSQQVVAGTLYKFDLVLEHNQDDSKRWSTMPRSSRPMTRSRRRGSP